MTDGRHFNFVGDFQVTSGPCIGQSEERTVLELIGDKMTTLSDDSVNRGLLISLANTSAVSSCRRL